MRLLAVLAITGCATPYAYTFRWVDPEVRVAGSTLITPLYPLYREKSGFSVTVLTR